jgi:hypothetical protein
VGGRSKAQGAMRTEGKRKFSGSLEVASCNRLLRFLDAKVAKAYGHSPETTLCPNLLPDLPSLLQRTSDLFNPGQELGDLQPLSF